MGAPWVLRGLRDGVVTTRWPRHPDPYFDTFRGAVQVIGELEADVDVDSICPTGAITGEGRTALMVDRSRCILCGRCVLAHPEAFGYVQGAGVARVGRPALTASADGDTEEEVAALREDLAYRVKALRRSVHIRHVDAGSDGSDEWEIRALVGPVYDIHRLGIFFTASPRHADILLVTGLGAGSMRAPLRRTLEAMPRPVVVIAAGTDTSAGGAIGGNAGLDPLLDVDVWVPGSPASPFSVLHGILLALGRLPAADGRGRP